MVISFLGMDPILEGVIIMNLKEIVERNKKAHHRLGLITKELYDTLSDGHHNSLRASQVTEMMNASFEMLKESDVLLSYADQELLIVIEDDLTEEPVKEAPKKAAKKPAAKKAAPKKKEPLEEAPVEEKAAKKVPAKKTTTKKAVAKKTEPVEEIQEVVAEEKPVKKAVAKKPAAKKAPAKKTTKK